MNTRSNDYSVNDLNSLLSSTDFYYIVGVKPGASTAEIRKAYLLRARKVHPDKHPTGKARDLATKAFQKLNEAHQTLFDTKKREQYDANYNNKRRSTSSSFPGTRSSTGSTPHNNNSNNSNRYSQNSWSQQGWDQWWQEAQQEAQEEAQRKQRQQQEEQQQRRQQQQQQREEWQRQQEQKRRQQERTKKEEQRRRQEDQRRQEKWEQQRRQEEAQLREKLRRQQEEQRRQKQQAQWEEQRRQRQQTYGITQTGQFCKRCIHQGGFCFQHKSQSQRQSSCQDHCRQQKRASAASSSPRPQYVPYGRCKNGQSCKLCEKKGGFCHHHRSQA